MTVYEQGIRADLGALEDRSCRGTGLLPAVLTLEQATGEATVPGVRVEGYATSGSALTRKRVGNRDVILAATQDSGSAFTALEGVDSNRAAAATYELTLHRAMDYISTHLALDLQTNSDGSPPPK